MINEFSELCVSASELYLDFLKRSDLGLSEIGVHTLSALDEHAKVWEFRLKSRLYDPESVQIRYTITGMTFGPDDFSIREYDADTGVLIIQFLQTPQVFKNGVRPHDVLVISSLLFLVQNVRDWFAKHGSHLVLPEKSGKCKTAIGQIEHALPNGNSLDMPLPEQASAIETALSVPLSYIWGPPGTGKTRLVLTHAVLTLVRRGCRVGVFAPTNIALEQAMDAILDGAARLGIEKELILRLGTPSRRFANSHPEVCEVQGIERRIEEAKRQIEILKTVIDHRRGQNALHSGESMLLILDQMKVAFGARETILHQLGALRQEASVLDVRLHKFTTRAMQFLTGKPPSEQSDRERVGVLERDAETRLAAIDAQIIMLTEDFRRTQTHSRKLTDIQSRFNPRTWQNSQKDLASILSEIREWISVREAVVTPYRQNSLEELQSLKTDWEVKVARLRKSTVAERMNSSRVVGMTLDLLIGRFREAPPLFDHLFLDEAGYASLIKGLSLFRHGSPVTMLGDHKQLPPIVEMNDDEINVKENRPINLWATTAIYCETAFHRGWTSCEWLDALWNSKLAKEPQFDHTERAILKTSRRFGANLCTVLDELLYQFGFTSANIENLQIHVINAPRGNAMPRKREAPTEVDAIAALLNNSALGDMAIITPYRHQLALLGRRLPSLQHEDRILTIHRSQGREWDTVIVSVVDGSGPKNSPWFTDTHNVQSRGAHVMNTAVSRARKRLIIVCEESFWRNKADRGAQLISRLIDDATPIS
jgi:hypothetical protein